MHLKIAHLKGRKPLFVLNGRTGGEHIVEPVRLIQQLNWPDPTGWCWAGQLIHKNYSLYKSVC
jgi:hypothetical protein